MSSVENVAWQLDQLVFGETGCVFWETCLLKASLGKFALSVFAFDCTNESLPEGVSFYKPYDVVFLFWSKNFSRWFWRKCFWKTKLTSKKIEVFAYKKFKQLLRGSIHRLSVPLKISIRKRSQKNWYRCFRGWGVLLSSQNNSKGTFLANLASRFPYTEEKP